jgi:hypothetical protein
MPGGDINTRDLGRVFGQRRSYRDDDVVHGQSLADTGLSRQAFFSDSALILPDIAVPRRDCDTPAHDPDALWDRQKSVYSVLQAVACDSVLLRTRRGGRASVKKQKAGGWEGL